MKVALHVHAKERAMMRFARRRCSFVRKLCGFAKPSHVNEAAFNQAVGEISHTAHHLLESLVKNAPLRNREIEAAKAKEQSAGRFAGRTCGFIDKTATDQHGFSRMQNLYSRPSFIRVFPWRTKNRWKSAAVS